MRPAATLSEPRLDLCPSYSALVDEFVSSGEKLVPFCLAYPRDDHERLIARLRDDSSGIGLADGFVPHSTFWLVSEGEVVAVSNLRHRLNEKLQIEGGHIGYGVRPSRRRKGYATVLLGLTLERARALGLKKAMLTCDKENAASARAIRHNGGVLEAEYFHPPRNCILQRYWIDLGGK